MYICVFPFYSPFHIDEDELRSPNKGTYQKRERAYTESNIATGVSILFQVHHPEGYFMIETVFI